MFALEILHHRHIVQYYEALLPAIVSSCAGYAIFIAITSLGIAPVWHFPQYRAEDLGDFAMAILYGVVGAIAGWLFILIFRALERVFKRLKCLIYWQTTLAGLGLGILAVLFPFTRYFGEHQLELVVEGNFSATTLLGLALAKMLAIAITVTGGWRGGIIIPLFFTGACLGEALADISTGVNSAFATICIMAALNATVTRTPISTAILLSKLTGFSPLTPILFASLVGFFLAPRIPFIASQLKLEQTDRSSVDA
jgi:H+/Cl- antiporter ClcA